MKKTQRYVRKSEEAWTLERQPGNRKGQGETKGVDWAERERGIETGREGDNSPYLLHH